MKLRIGKKIVCDGITPISTGDKVEFLMTADWIRVPKGKAEIVDDAGTARPVELSVRRVGFNELFVTATFTKDSKSGMKEQGAV
jgi:hypothetical protein